MQIEDKVIQLIKVYFVNSSIHKSLKHHKHFSRFKTKFLKILAPDCGLDGKF